MLIRMICKLLLLDNDDVQEASLNTPYVYHRTPLPIILPHRIRFPILPLRPPAYP
jgi:hypothetical protein